MNTLAASCGPKPATVSAAPFSLTEVSFGYSSTRLALQEVSFEVRKGEFVALVGPNGAGKTTLLHILTGYLSPTVGRAELFGRPSVRLPRHETAAMVAYVPQHQEDVFSFTAAQVVLMGRNSRSTFGGMSDSAADLSRAADALQQVGMLHRAGKSLNELSGGERQLVLFARALAQETPALVLDEPTASLDPKNQLEIMRLIHRLHGERATTIVATLHDLNLAARFAQRLIMLANGRVVAQGTPEEVLTPEVLQAVYGTQIDVSRREDGSLRVDIAAYG